MRICRNENRVVRHSWWVPAVFHSTRTYVCLPSLPFFLGKEELLSLQRKNPNDGKRLACLVLKTVEARKPSSLPVVLPSVTPSNEKEKPASPRYTDWECNLCRDIDRPHKFSALQQLKSHYAGTHDMDVMVLCGVCGQGAPRRLLSASAGDENFLRSFKLVTV